MLKKFAAYFFLSLFSFGFFTGIFHTVAHAQVSALISPQGIKKVSFPSPTLFVRQTEKAQASTPSPTPTQAQKPLPTPTVYMASRATTETAVAASVEDNPVVVKTVETEITPTPEAVKPTITSTPTPNPTDIPTPQPIASTATDMESLFGKYSAEYSVDKELLKKIAKCESGFNTNSNNSGMYLGMFQFASLTWVNNRARMGLDTNPDLRTNAEESIKTAAYMISKGGVGAWPNCSK